MGVVFVLALILGGMRVFGVTHVAFQAAAHLFVGGLFGGWLMNATNEDRIAAGRPVKWWLLWLFLFMTALEVACFLLIPSELRTQLLRDLGIK